MENIIAIRVTFDDQPTRHVLTWGRIQDPVDHAPVEKLVADYMSRRGTVTSCTICDSLQEAAHTRYFYESFFDMCQRTIPFGDGYDAWERERDQVMRNGREFRDCGVPPEGRR